MMRSKVFNIRGNSGTVIIDGKTFSGDVTVYGNVQTMSGDIRDR